MKLLEVLNAFLGRDVAKRTDTIVARADKVLADVDTLQVRVVTKGDLRALRRLETVARKR